MESLAYTHLALAYEEPSSLELSSIEVLNLLTKLSLLSLFKQQKLICKAWLYGLSLSLTFIPFADTLALHQAEGREQVNNLVSNQNPKMVLESANSSSLNLNEKTQSASISSSKRNESQKVLLVKGDQEKVNLTNLVNRTSSIQTISTTQPIQDAEKKLSKSNPNSKTKPEHKIEPEQKGKLRLVNDTPYIGIVVLYKPGSQHPYRYAHIPACHKRELLGTYSNHWQVSFNNSNVSSVSKVSVKDNNFFEIKTSKLTKKSEVNPCLEASKAQLIQSLQPRNQDKMNKIIKDFLGLKLLSKSQNEIEKFQKVANYMEQLITEIENHDLSIIKQILSTSKNNYFNDKDYDKNYGYYGKRYQNNSVYYYDYCVIDYLLQKAAIIYKYYSRTIDNNGRLINGNILPDGNVHPQEITLWKQYFFNNANPYDRKPEQLTQLIIINELFLSIRTDFYANLSSQSPLTNNSWTPQSVSNKKYITTKLKETEMCEQKFKENMFKSASIPDKKTKHC